MNKTILLILALTASAVMGQACSSNMLATQYDFTLLGSATSGSDLGFCKTLQNGNTCCSAATIATFQDKADELVARLEGLAGERDKLVIEKRGVVVGMKDSLDRLKAAAEAFASSSEAQNDQYAQFLEIGHHLAEMAGNITQNFDQLRSNFSDFQKARATCMVTLVQTQAAAWCLACNPDPTTNGVGQSDLSLSDDLKQRVLDACFDYVQYSAGQGIILSLFNVKSIIDGLASAMEKLVQGDSSALTDLVSVFSEMANQAPPPDAEAPVDVPPNCDAQSCDWMFASAFLNGMIDEDVIARGGRSSNEENNVNRLLRNLGDNEVITRPAARKLVNSWSPAANEAGVTVSFEENPGDVDNSATLFSITSALVAITVAFF